MTKVFNVGDFRRLPEELQVECIDKVAKFYNSASGVDSAAIGRLGYVDGWFRIAGKDGDGYSLMSINDGNFPAKLKIYLDDQAREELKAALLDSMNSVKQIEKM